MSIKKYTNEELKKLDNKMDYDRIKNMSEEENTKTDEDSTSPSDEELKKVKKVKNNGGGKN